MSDRQTLWRKAEAAWTRVLETEKDGQKREIAKRHLEKIRGARP